MKLSEFVRDTLVQIIEGACDAQGRAEELGGGVNPHPVQSRPAGDQIAHYTYNPGTDSYSRIQQVRFDVALTATEESKAAGSVAVAVLGGRLESSGSASSASRIQFEVPIALPVPPRRKDA